MEEIVAQVKKLFSNKNSSKSAQSWANRLHRIKMLVIVLAITILIGYKQFRDHFDCLLHPHSSKQLDRTALVNFCWTNGTYTVENKVDFKHMPHVGIYFTHGQGNTIVSHDRISWLWMALIAMLTCSILAEMSWSKLFCHQVLRSVLKLEKEEKKEEKKDKSKDQKQKSKEEQNSTTTSGSKSSSETHVELNDRCRSTSSDPDSDNVRATCSDLMVPSSATSTLTIVERTTHNNKLNTAAPIVHHPRDLHNDKYQFSLESLSHHRQHHHHHQPETHSINDVRDVNRTSCLVKIVDDNSYDNAIDVYVEGLVKFFTSRSSRRINIARQYVQCQLVSFSLTCLQCFIPLMVIGHEYLDYGWIYMIQSGPDGSMHHRAYHLWPVITQCRYEHWATTGDLEYLTTFCTIPLNALCGVLFVAIWWCQAIDLLFQTSEFVRIMIMYNSYGAARHLLSPYWHKVAPSIDYICRFPLLLDNHLDSSKTPCDADHIHHHDHQVSRDNDPHRTMINVLFVLYLLRLRLGSRNLMNDVIVHLAARLHKIESSQL